MRPVRRGNKPKNWTGSMHCRHTGSERCKHQGWWSWTFRYPVLSIRKYLGNLSPSAGLNLTFLQDWAWRSGVYIFIRENAINLVRCYVTFHITSRNDPPQPEGSFSKDESGVTPTDNLAVRRQNHLWINLETRRCCWKDSSRRWIAPQVRVP
jgi:hypothetical protein